MNAPTPVGELFQAMAEGLSQPRHAREALVIVVSFAVAWIASRVLVLLLVRRQRGRLAGVPASGAAAQPAESVRGLLRLRAQAMADSILALRRPLFPLLALLLLWAGEGLLRWQHVLFSASDARLLRLAMSFAGALAAVRVLFGVLRRVFGQSAWIAVVERCIAVAAILGVVLYATGAWDDVVGWLRGTEIPLGTSAKVSLWSILVGSSTTLVALLAAMWLGAFVEERLDAQPKLDPNLRTVLSRVARALLLVVALLFALALSGIDLTVLSVFGGALGVGLGLGLQRVASNYVSGFILLLDKSLRIGDFVAADKYYGRVVEIRTRYTVLRSLDGTDAVVPNEMLVSSPVVNYTMGDRRLALSVPVAVGPDVDIDLALRLMCEAAASCARVLPEPAPAATLKEVQGGNLVLEIGFWIGDPENGRQSAQSEVALAVVRRFRERGIALGVPRGDFQWHESVADKARAAARRP